MSVSNLNKVRVAVVRGGQPHGYENSLKTGEHVLAALREMPDIYEPIDIFISKDGEWHYGGLAHKPHHALRHADVIWNALHDSYGEDGQVQSIFEDLKIPFTGSGSEASALAMDREISKQLYREHSLMTPAHELLNREGLNDEQLITIFRTYLQPVVIKPASGIRAFGTRLARTFQELKKAVKEAFYHSPRVLVEEFVKGHDVNCVVIDSAKGEEIYALLPSSAYNLRAEESRRIEEMAKRAHQALGLRHYSGSDFVLTPKGNIYILGTRSLPVFHEGSPTHHSLSATGWRPREFVDHVIKLAM